MVRMPSPRCRLKIWFRAQENNLYISFSQQKLWQQVNRLRWFIKWFVAVLSTYREDKRQTIPMSNQGFTDTEFWSETFKVLWALVQPEIWKFLLILVRSEVLEFLSVLVRSSSLRTRTEPLRPGSTGFGPCISLSTTKNCTGNNSEK